MVSRQNDFVWMQGFQENFPKSLAHSIGRVSPADEICIVTRAAFYKNGGKSRFYEIARHSPRE